MARTPHEKHTPTNHSLGLAPNLAQPPTTTGGETLAAQPSQLAYQHPALANAREAVEREQRWRESAERQAMLRVHRAIRLAPTLEVCEALLRGERVPRTALDPMWRKAYGL